MIAKPLKKPAGGELKKESKTKKEASEINTKEYHPEKESLFDKKSLVLVFFNALLLAGIAYLGYTFFQDKKQESTTGTQITVKTVSPSPKLEEPSKKANLEEFSINVLNGSGTAGVASNVSSLLEEIGFDNIEVGDADSYDFTDTEVKLKEEVPDSVFEKIKEALSGYSVNKSETLADNSQYEVVIIIGSKRE